MNLKNWSWDHTKGLILGLITPVLMVPVVILILSWIQDFSFDRLWHKFVYFEKAQIKYLTLSIIANLFWFYFFLNRERYKFAMGVILGSILYGPYIIYIKFF